MRRCVLNFADGIFIKAQDRLRKSLATTGFEGDIMFVNEIPAGCPPHALSPWAFKVHMLEEARKAGYDQALWLDSSTIVVRSLDAIFARAERYGVCAFSRFTATVGEWSSDLALTNIGITRDEAFKIPEINASCIAIDFKHPKGISFLTEWKKFADDGASFLGVRDPLTLADSMTNDRRQVSSDSRVRGHRHDQTAASVILDKLHVPLSSRYVFDLIGEAKPGDTYACTIPLDAAIVQNRDVKTAGFLDDLSGYALALTPTTLFYTLTRVIKDIIRIRILR
jgi:hypothetical protein